MASADQLCSLRSRTVSQLRERASESNAARFLHRLHRHHATSSPAVRRALESASESGLLHAAAALDTIFTKCEWLWIRTECKEFDDGTSASAALFEDCGRREDARAHN